MVKVYNDMTEIDPQKLTRRFEELTEDERLDGAISLLGAMQDDVDKVHRKVADLTKEIDAWKEAAVSQQEGTTKFEQAMQNWKPFVQDSDKMSRQPKLSLAEFEDILWNSLCFDTKIPFICLL